MAGSSTTDRDIMLDVVTTVREQSTTNTLTSTIAASPRVVTVGKESNNLDGCVGGGEKQSNSHGAHPQKEKQPRHLVGTLLLRKPRKFAHSRSVVAALTHIATNTIPAAAVPVAAGASTSGCSRTASVGGRTGGRTGGRRSSTATVVINVARSLTQQGRDFQSVYTNHRYTSRELSVLAGYDSFDYLPGHSAVYKQWLQRQPARLDWDRWVMMGLIGVTIGFVGFMLQQVIHLISHVKWQRAEQLVQENSLVTAWLWTVGFSLVFAAASAASVAFICHSAGGSGIPEVIGFLNGTVMRHVLNLPAFLVKFFSCSCAVGAGLPVGPEGPMIHIGSIVGTGLSQFRSRTLNITLPFFTRFRNPEDRRNFTTAGAAAGVAAAFGAPVGGLLFAMEEVSSFWSMKLGWMIFFSCMLATFTADLFNSSFDDFHFDGMFGLFKTDKYIIFKLGSAIPVNIIMFAPALLIGFLGGILGALFTVLNLKIARLRRRILSKLRRSLTQKILSFFEPLLIVVIWATITLFLPAAFPCRSTLCTEPATTKLATNGDQLPITAGNRWLFESSNGAAEGDAPSSSTDVNKDAAAAAAGDNNKPSSGAATDETNRIHCPPPPTSYYVDIDQVQPYWCTRPDVINGTRIAGEYNEVASLLNVNVHHALRLLFSRRTHLQFSYDTLLTVLPIYFVLSCWAAGSASAGGIVLPMLFIGGLYGRAVGRLLVDFHGGIPTDPFWQWIDPGAMALIGAASFFGGVSRLTMSLSVIMIEITNDVAFLLPTMVAIMMAKWVGDYITHPLYHSLLELHCIPFLYAEPIVYDDHSCLLNLELFKARDVMHRPVITITPRETLAHLARLLLETSHGGFPVVKYFEQTRQEVAYGLLTRTELCVILCHDRTRSMQFVGATISPQIPYEEISVERLSNDVKLMQILEDYARKPMYANIYLDLEPFINRSAPHIAEDFSLYRTYIVFRTLGLRHMIVVDMANRVVGIITRKDLMGFNLEQKLELRRRRGYSVDGGTQKLLPSERVKKLTSTSLSSSLTAVDLNGESPV